MKDAEETCLEEVLSSCGPVVLFEGMDSPVSWI